MCSDEGLSGARFRQILLVGAAVEREPSLKYFTIQFYVHPGDEQPLSRISLHEDFLARTFSKSTLRSIQKWSDLTLRGMDASCAGNVGQY